MIARYKPFLVWTAACFLVIFILGEGYFAIWKAPEKVWLILLIRVIMLLLNFVGCSSKSGDYGMC